MTRRPAAVRAIVCGAIIAAVGAACGLLWGRLWTPAHGVVQGGVWYPSPWDAGEQHDFAGTAWYVVIALVAGSLLGLLAALAASGSELVVLGAVAAGSVVGGLLMWRVGLLSSPGDPVALAKHARDGTRLEGSLHLADVVVVWPRRWHFVVPLVSLPMGALGALTAAYLCFGSKERPPAEGQPGG